MCDLAIGAVDCLFHLVKCLVERVRKYKDKVNDLKDEQEKLKKLTEDIKAKVQSPEAKEWIDKAERKMLKVDEFTTNETSANENIQLFEKLSFPNFIWRYTAIKKSEDMIRDVQHLIKKLEEVKLSRPSERKIPIGGDYETVDSRAEVFVGPFPVLKKIIKKKEQRSSRKSRNTRKKKNKVNEVHEPAGVGKTTLVKVIGNQQIEDGTFYDSAVADVSQNAGAKDITRQNASRLSPQLEFPDKDLERRRQREEIN